MKAFIHPRVDLWSADGYGGHGALALGDLDEGELLISVPWEECEIAESATALSHRVKGRRTECVCAWTREERQLLRGTELEGVEEMDSAACVVMSRAVELSRGWVLAPYVDCLNHSFRTNARLYEVAEGLEMRAITKICRGEKVEHEYDTTTPADMLLRYGFYCDRALPAAVYFADGAIAATEHDPLPNELVGLYAVQYMSPEQLSEARLEIGEDLNLVDYESLLEENDSLRQKVNAALSSELRSRLSRYYPCSIFTKPPVTRRKLAAKRLRDAEVRVLSAALILLK